jgi:hypothetical protein
VTGGRHDSFSTYLVSLPERVLRSVSALAGGLVREIGDVTIPARVRRTHLYRSLVDETLRFVIEKVGEVKGTYPVDDDATRGFLLRRTAGNGIELAGILAFRASPVWVLAALADISGAGRDLIREIAATLQSQGLMEPGSNTDTVEQILDGLEKTAGRAAHACNMPPLDVAGLRKEWKEIREAAAHIPAPNLPSAESIRNGWEDLKKEAAAQERAVFELSSLLALSAVRRVPAQLRWLGQSTISAAQTTKKVFAGALLEHYSKTLHEIHETGFVRYWMREFRPYLKAAVVQFSPRHRSLTGRFFASGK